MDEQKYLEEDVVMRLNRLGYRVDKYKGKIEYPHDKAGNPFRPMGNKVLGMVSFLTRRLKKYKVIKT